MYKNQGTLHSKIMFALKIKVSRNQSKETSRLRVYLNLKVASTMDLYHPDH